MNKRIFDIIFMIISTIILVILLEYGFLEKYIGFALIPILIALKNANQKFTNKVNSLSCNTIILQ
jgi:hypothetical protein